MFSTSKLCRCGSGEIRRDLRDAAGIFCTFVCDACEDRRRATFNPAIFDNATYAACGEEAALACDEPQPRFAQKPRRFDA